MALIHPEQPNRRRLVRRGRSAAREVDICRITAHLGCAVPEIVRGTALAFVVVDDPQGAALPLVSLATSCAQQGQRIVLADFASGAPQQGCWASANLGSAWSAAGRPAGCSGP